MEQAHLPGCASATYEPEQQDSVAVGEENRLWKEGEHRNTFGGLQFVQCQMTCQCFLGRYPRFQLVTSALVRRDNNTPNLNLKRMFSFRR